MFAPGTKVRLKDGRIVGIKEYVLGSHGVYEGNDIKTFAKVLFEKEEVKNVVGVWGNSSPLGCGPRGSGASPGAPLN